LNESTSVSSLAHLGCAVELAEGSVDVRGRWELRDRRETAHEAFWMRLKCAVEHLLAFFKPILSNRGFKAVLTGSRSPF